MHRLRFRDRADAGRKLAAELRARKLGLAGWGPTVLGKDPIVLALARGGVPVGLEIAEALQAPLDVMVVCKLSVPAQPELAMGALAHGIRVVDRVLTAALGISHQEVEWIAAKETLELERREREYRQGRPEPSLVGRTVILADDGLATGSTMVAAARHARSAGAHRLIVAAPVGSAEACERLQGEADHCACLAVEKPFHAVGEWYADFRQVSDAEVHQILDRVHSRVGIS